MDKNKVRFGLSNVHVGSVDIGENGNPTLGIPKPYPGAVNLTMNPEGEVTPFNADNMVYYMSSSNNGYTGELEMAYLYEWFEKEYLGAKQSEEGMIVEVADTVEKYIYLMFQFDGDVNGTRHILYHVQCSRPSIDGKTTEGKTKEPITTTIPYTATPLKTAAGNIVKAKCSKGQSNYDKFFTEAPQLPTFAAEPVKS